MVLAEGQEKKVVLKSRQVVISTTEVVISSSKKRSKGHSLASIFLLKVQALALVIHLRQGFWGLLRSSWLPSAWGTHKGG